MGLRKKIRLGFIIISCLLFFAGIISYLEIMRLDAITEKIVSIGAKSVVVSNEMLDIISHQDSTVINFIQTKDTAGFISESTITLSKLKSLTQDIEDTFSFNQDIKDLMESQNSFINVLQNKPDSVTIDSKWYFSTYKGGYNKFVVTVKNFMRSTQEYVINETTKLKLSAYRAIKQGIISLATAIVIIIIFFSLIDVYYIRPVIQITKGLKNYHNLKIPFNVTIVGRDEVFMLKEYIDQLMLKINAKNRNNGSLGE